MMRPSISFFCGVLLALVVSCGDASGGALDDVGHEVGRQKGDAKSGDHRLDAEGAGDADVDAGGQGDADAESDAGSSPPEPDASRCQIDPSVWAQTVDDFERQLRENGVPGGAIAVVCGDEIVSAGVGVTAHPVGAPIGAETRFQIASVTKSFTGALAALLADQGRVDLLAPISSYVPFVDLSRPYGLEPTLEQLLTHTAGYPTDLPAGGRFDDLTLRGFYAANPSLGLWSPPGAVFNYSNIGTSLAGLALQEHLDTPFGDLMQREIFTPLGLLSASMDAAGVEAAGDVAFGHQRSVDSIVRPTDTYLATGYYGPMGGAWMSVTDLARFARELMKPKVLGDAASEILRIRAKAQGGQSRGLSLFHDAHYDEPHYSHGGSVGGYRAKFEFWPESKFGVAYLANADWYFPQETPLELSAYSSIERRDASAFPELVVDPLSWGDYVGTYSDTEVFGSLTISQRESGELMLEIPSWQISAPLFPVTRTGFVFPTGVPQNPQVYVDFVRGEMPSRVYFVTLYGVAQK